MAVVWADVVALDAKLSAVPVATQNIILSDCVALLDASRWGAKLDMGVRLLAAHFGALDLRGGSAASTGAIQHQGLGLASQSFAVNQAMAFGDLESTVFGKRFKWLMRSVVTTALAI